MFDSDQPPIFNPKQPNPNSDRGKYDDPLNEDVFTNTDNIRNFLLEGVVIEAYPDSYVVDVSTSEGVISGCRLPLYAAPDSGAGEISLPEIGARCLISYQGRAPSIICYAAEPDSNNTTMDSSKRFITAGTTNYGGNDANYKGIGPDNERQGRPSDILPGDWARISTEGNLLAVLRGISVLKGSEFSQIIATQLGGLLRLVSKNYQHFNSLGEIQILNKNGKSSLIFRGATDQLTQSGKEREGWTIRLDAGAEGNLVNLRITTPQDETLAKLHIDPSGNVDILESAVNIRITKNKTEYIKGNVSSTIEGSYSREAAKSVTYKFNSACNTEIKGNYSITIGQNKSEKILGEHTQFIKGNSTRTISGKTKDNLNNGLTVEVNNPANGSSSTEKLKFWNYLGEVEIGSTSKKVSVKSDASEIEISGRTGVILTSTSIKFGGPTAAFSLVTYEGLRTYLTVLETWLDTHAHAQLAVPPTILFNPLARTVETAPKSNICKTIG